MSLGKRRETIRTLNVISRCLSYVREGQFSKYGITRAQQSFCSRIYENPGISQNNLSHLLRMDKTTTSKAIKKLMDLEFVSREKSKTNHKEWNLYVTDKFSNIREGLDDDINRTIDEMLIDVDEQELEIFDDVLNKIRDNIVQEWEETKNKNITKK